MKILTRRTAALVAGGALLLVAGGVGGATGAALITGADIKDGSITKLDLGKNSVIGTKIKDGTITAVDMAAGAIPPPVTTIMQVQPYTTTDITLKTNTAACAAGEVALGGGYQVTLPDGQGVVGTLDNLRDMAVEGTDFDDLGSGLALDTSGFPTGYVSKVQWKHDPADPDWQVKTWAFCTKIPA